MSNRHLYTMREAAAELGTYPQLVRNLAELHNVPVYHVGGAIAVDAEGLESLRCHLEAWNNRPRISRVAAASA
jgi:hypothetical protein